MILVTKFDENRSRHVLARAILVAEKVYVKIQILLEMIVVKDHEPSLFLIVIFKISTKRQLFCPCNHQPVYLSICYMALGLGVLMSKFGDHRKSIAVEILF